MLVVVLVASIAGPLLVLGALLTFVLTRKARTGREWLSAELRDDPAIRGPERAVYRGSTGGYSQVDGNGQLALTRSRLLFRKTVGGAVEVPLAEVTEVRAQKTFRRSVVGDKVHLVVRTHRGEVGYFVADLDAWIAAISAAVPRLAQP